MTKSYDVVVALLTLTDIIVIVAMYPLLPPRAIENLFVYIFDVFVVAVMALGFYARMRKSQQGKKIFILNNWYELPAMVPIAVFAAARSFTIYDDIIVVGIMFRALGVLYVLRLFSFIRDNLRIFGGNRTLQVFINFYLALMITTFFFLLFYLRRHFPTFN